MIENFDAMYLITLIIRVIVLYAYDVLFLQIPYISIQPNDNTPRGQYTLYPNQNRVGLM